MHIVYECSTAVITKLFIERSAGSSETNKQLGNKQTAQKQTNKAQTKRKKGNQIGEYIGPILIVEEYIGPILK